MLSVVKCQRDLMFLIRQAFIFLLAFGSLALIKQRERRRQNKKDDQDEKRNYRRKSELEEKYGDFV